MQYNGSATRNLFLSTVLLAFLSLEASGQITKGMTTIGSFVRPGTLEACSGIWGWTGSNGKEYALVTSRNPGGLSIVDISTPTVPREVSFIPSTGNSIWHEVNVFRNYAYKVSQNNNDGLQIINLAPLNTGGKAVLISSSTLRFKVAHTLFIDTTTTPARLFVTYNQANGVMIFTLADPENPTYVATHVGETHDIFARGDKMYASNQSKSALTIWSLADLAVPLKVSTIDFTATNTQIGEPLYSLSHNAWPSEDNKTLFTTEETVGCSMKAWDISTATLSKPPTLIGKYLNFPNLISHNAYVKGNLLFLAHYTAGIRVIDITDATKMTEIAYSRHSASTQVFAGSWGCYAWFKSGLIIHGDAVGGLYIEKLDASVSAKHPDPKDANFSIVAMNNNILNLRLSKAGPYELSIFSLAGKEMAKLPGRGDSRIQTLSLGPTQLASGNYMVRLRQDSQILTVHMNTRN